MSRSVEQGMLWDLGNNPRYRGGMTVEMNRRADGAGHHLSILMAISLIIKYRRELARYLMNDRCWCGVCCIFISIGMFDIILK